MALSNVDVALFKDHQERTLEGPEIMRRLNLFTEQTDQSIQDITEPSGVSGNYVVTNERGTRSVLLTITDGLVTAAQNI